MTKPNIEEIEKQLDGITPGYWRNYKTTVESYTITPDLPFPQEDEFIARIPDSDADGAFIASAPSTIRSLIAYIKELEAENGQHVAKILHLENNALKMIAEREKYDPNLNLTF